MFWPSCATLLLSAQGGIITAKGNSFPTGEEIPSVGTGAMQWWRWGTAALPPVGVGFTLGVLHCVGICLRTTQNKRKVEREKEKTHIVSVWVESRRKCGKRGGKWKTHSYSLLSLPLENAFLWGWLEAFDGAARIPALLCTCGLQTQRFSGINLQYCQAAVAHVQFSPSPSCFRCLMEVPQRLSCVPRPTASQLPAQHHPSFGITHPEGGLKMH